jgi:hypothetical protein
MALIAVVTIVVGVLNHSFTGFPKGYDAYGHLSKVKLLVDYFPNADWNHEWYSGMLYSEGSFPALFHYVGWFLVAGLGLSTAAAFIAISAASFVAIGWGLYGIVRVATGNHLAALAAVFALTSSPAYWLYILEGGLYPRIIGMAFIALFGFFAVLYHRDNGRLPFVAMVISLAGVLSSHLLVGAIGVALALLVIVARPISIAQRLLEAGKLLVPTGLVVAYFYLPYAVQRPRSVPLFTSIYPPVPLSSLFVPGTPGGQFESLPFFLVPATIGLAAVAAVSRRLPKDAFARRLIVIFGIAGLVSLMYTFIGLPAPARFIYAFQPGQALFFATWFLSAVVGLTLSSLKLPLPAIAGVLVFLIAFTVVTTADVARGEIVGENSVKQELQAALQVDQSERQYRVGVSWDGASDWINSRSDVPQTGGYQQQGQLNPDWQYWLQTAVWNRAPNYKETNFLLDWFGVKSLYGGPDPTVVDKFEARPDLYRSMTPQASPIARTFEFINATPVLSASSTRTALVIGDDAAYTLVLKAVSLSDFDSQLLIPIRGGTYLDDRSPTELAQFDQVILYGFRVHSRAKASALLAAYVTNGGSVVIEANNSPFEDTASAPEPIPGTQVKKVGIGPAWNLTGRPSPITSGIDLAAFAPASYQGGPWGISYIPLALIRSWAEPVLLSDGRPVLVAGTLGRGRLVWSGLNLPYHAVTNHTEQESRLLAQEIAWASPSRPAASDYVATFVNPQLRQIKVSGPAMGVLFKENWFANWHVSIDGKPVTLYQAGPGFMYVPFPHNQTFPADVTFQFARSPVEWLGDAISVAALVALLGYLLGGIGMLRRRRMVPSAIR